MRGKRRSRRNETKTSRQSGTVSGRWQRPFLRIANAASRAQSSARDQVIADQTVVCAVVVVSAIPAFDIAPTVWTYRTGSVASAPSTNRLPIGGKNWIDRTAPI